LSTLPRPERGPRLSCDLLIANPAVGSGQQRPERPTMRKPERVFTRARSHHMTIQAQPWSPSSYPTTTRLRGNARHPFVAEALAGPAAVSRRERSSAPTTAGARMQQHGIAEARYCSTPGAAVSWSARWWLLSWRTSSQTPVRSNSAAPDVDLAPVDSRIIWAMQSSRRPRYDGCARGKALVRE
jgi:hypothetical protein